MRDNISNQRGAIIVIFALALVVLIGFAALGIEAGQWYLTRAELSKAVAAAALAGAANISNKTINIETLAQDFGMENFQPGYLGTAKTGFGEVSFIATTAPGGLLTVTGQTNASAILTGIFGINYVAVNSVGAAQKNNVQIMMVLDRSGSMAGTPISDLQNAAETFVGYYKDTQADDQIGLVSFATGVTVDYQLNTNFYTPIVSKINALNATGATNAEDALAQAGAAFADQTLVPPANRVQQYIIFFTDGHPTAFRSKFTLNGAPYDRVLCSTGNCDSDSDGLYSQMGYPNNETFDSTVNPDPTGDGLPVGSTKCKTGKRNPTGYVNTRWGSFASYPVSGLGNEAYPAYCSINSSSINGQNGYICTTAKQMAIDNVNALKAKLVMVYTIGLGTDVDSTFLQTLASGPDFFYNAPSSSDLESIFSKIAKDIKLRLIQ